MTPPRVETSDRYGTADTRPLAASQTQTRRTRTKHLRRALAVTLTLGVLIAATWGTYRWATYPDVPDVAATDLNESIAFMGTDEFNRMFAGHRKRYAMSIVAELEKKPFEDLVRLMLERDGRKLFGAVRNFRDIPGREDIEDAFGRLFLGKFYEMPKIKRDMYLAMFVGAERMARGSARPGAETGDKKADGQGGRPGRRGGTPSPDQFKAQWSKFANRQPPRVQAQTGQFLMDLRRQQEIMGVKRY